MVLMQTQIMRNPENSTLFIGRVNATDESTGRAKHSFILPEDRRMPEIKDSLKWEFERSQKNLIPRMAEDGPFLMGEEMTIADILLAHCGGWAISAKFPIVEERFREFVSMMRDRPAFARAVAA